MEKHIARKKMFVRDRIDALLDPGCAAVALCCCCSAVVVTAAALRPSLIVVAVTPLQVTVP